MCDEKFYVVLGPLAADTDDATVQTTTFALHLSHTDGP